MRSEPGLKLGWSFLGLMVCLRMVLGAGSGCNPAVPPLVQPLEYPAARQVHQRSGNSADIPIRGFYDATAFPTPAIQVQARRDSFFWTTIDASPSGGVFEGVLPNQDIGYDDLEIRILGAGAPTVMKTIPDVGVGDVYAIAGQSNAVGFTETQRASNRPSSTLMLDPPAGQLFKWTADPLHEQAHIQGSVWPRLADLIEDQTDIPVMFVATAQFGAGLVSPPDWAVDDCFWDRMIQNISVATSGENCIRAVLWFQGESDAAGAVSYTDYKNALKNFAASLQTEMSCSVPLVAAVLGTIDQLPEPNVEAIRDAIRDAASESPHIRRGPETADLPTIDGVHFGDNTVNILRDRWCLRLETYYNDLECDD